MGETPERERERGLGKQQGGRVGLGKRRGDMM